MPARCATVCRARLRGGSSSRTASKTQPDMARFERVFRVLPTGALFFASMGQQLQKFGNGAQHKGERPVEAAQRVLDLVRLVLACGEDHVAKLLVLAERAKGRDVAAEPQEALGLAHQVVGGSSQVGPYRLQL